MMKNISVILFLFVSFSISAQKWDYQWVFGYGQESSLPGFGISMLDFNDNLVAIDSVLIDFQDYDINNASSFICDEEGQLMLTTNNCSVRNSQYEIIENGDNLNPGSINDEYCPNGSYPDSKANFILPSLVNDSTYYVIHKDKYIDFDIGGVLSRNLCLSKVIKRGNGTLYLKEKTIIFNHNLKSWNMSSIINPLDNTWWVAVRGLNSDTLFSFKIGGGITDFEGPNISITGPEVNTNSGAEMTFSPDGTMMGDDNIEHGVMLYDFDMESGTFSHRENHPFPNMDNTGTLMFSPNSRFIYLTGHRCIYQMDLDQVDGDDFIIRLDTIAELGSNGWPISAGRIYPGPDCRLYISPRTTTFSIHVIHDPDLKAPDCNYVRNAILSPTRLLHQLPNMPTWRPEGNCNYDIDWGIMSAINNLPMISGEMTLSPNPARTNVNFTIMDDEVSTTNEYQLRVYDVSGGILLQKSIKFIQNSFQHDFSSLSNGIYFYTAQSQSGRKYTGRFVIAR